ncbi:MAG: hypothetical protein H6862_06765 [Rhodospirillales bacterium]|nr:hypothetical protein [Rhodospirillales bacterium]
MRFVFWKIMVVLCGFAGLAGCTNLSTIETVRAAGKTFHDELYANYRELALYEGRQAYDFADSEYFAAKARMAFGGGYVEPTLLNERDLPDFSRPTLEKARFDLMRELQGRMGDPESWKNLASAQVSFDCWVEEQEENRQPDRISFCRNRFETAMAVLAGTAP